MLSAFLAVLLAVQSAPAQQRNDRRTWYQAYADAQRDVQQKNWQQAIADVEAASRLGAPKPGRNILFYGDVYRDFNPDYYLGIAYQNLNRFDDADRAFERVKQAQLIAPRDSLYAEFTRQATAVKGALEKQTAGQLAAATSPQVVPPVVPTQAPVQNAGVSDQNPTGPPTNPPLPTPVQQSPIDRAPVQTNSDLNGPGVPTNAGRNGAPVIVQPRVNRGATTNAVVKAPPLRPASPGTLAEERSALVDFFSGQYEIAANKLSAITAKQNGSGRAYFYLACSHAALALTGKVDAATGIAEARAQLALARDTGQYALDKALISPRIKLTLGMQP